MTTFVEHPAAAVVTSALCRASAVSMRRGVRPSSTRPTDLLPLSFAMRYFFPCTAWVAPLPGSDIPSASVMSCIETAVPMPLQAPGPCLLYTSDAADDLLCVDLG